MIVNELKIRYTDKTGTVVTSENFFPLSVDDKPLVSSIPGETLGGVLYDHVKFSRMKYTVVLSADTVRPQRAFLRAFFVEWRKAEIQMDGDDWLDVMIPRGEEPRELVNGRELAPRYTFVFTERAGTP